MGRNDSPRQLYNFFLQSISNRFRQFFFTRTTEIVAVDAPLQARSHDANTARAHTQGVRVDHEDDFQGETAPVFYQTPRYYSLVGQ
jgi:hypothetical protein